MSSADTAPSPEASGSETASHRRHPAGLSILFFTELWERFSFYGMRSLLTLYLKTVLRYSDQAAYGVYHAYGTLVYALPVAGGWLADRLLGCRLAVVIGALLMAAGHFAMAVPNEVALYLALALLCLGVGLFKPNISSLVGQLYAEGDPRRDAGFTIFYMGINIGAFVAPLVCGTLGEKINWHYGFGVAGLGMLIGVGWFLRGQGKLQGHGSPPDPARLTRPTMAGLNPLRLTLLATIALVPLVALALWRNAYVGYLLYLAGAVVYGGLVIKAWRASHTVRDRLLVALALMACSTVFWALFEQAGSSLTLFTQRNVDRNIIPNVAGLRAAIGADVPASVFLAVNPLYIMLLGFPFAAMWTFLKRAQRDPSTPLKFSLGLVQVGAGFIVLVFGASLASNGLAHVTWLLLMYLLHTTGELCVSPVGLSAMTKLAPSGAVSTVMGAWFLASSYSQYFGGIVAKLTAIGHSANTTADTIASLRGYTTVFTQLGWLAVGVGIVLAVVSPLLKRQMHGVD